ncbi:antibiotic biosynthesis monooxygenase [Methylobacterium oryzihabitans]|uniref:Antibiotic biosynthesis monooxygenase n=1 Tax=Methylobacterium oryzihabitans TaxID=2499852 RepID=A0A437PC30_9HYPH|nr:antibiotic biosynthesis monooxygenase [Methylobacterium oryzihabitans]RVU19814.1 antibiotic biosynthesis monooxygenase [Methylobacterium oryzihabitans]
MNLSVASPAAAAVTRIRLRPGAAAAFAAWQARLTHAVASAPGFVSVEIVPVFADAHEWHVVQRFRSPEALAQWRASPERAALAADLVSLREAEDEDEAAPDFHSLSCVTEVITTAVGPGRAADYRSWAETVQARQATFPGYMGTLVQAPLGPELNYWTTLVRFSTPSQLDAWIVSEERHSLLRAADPAMSTWSSRRHAGPFAGWFAVSPDAPAPPPAWKQTLVVLLVLFPVVMLEIRFLSPLLTGLPAPVATLIGNAISVALVSWPLARIAGAALRGWLHPPPQRRAVAEIVGAAAVVAAFVAELTVFTLWT